MPRIIFALCIAFTGIYQLNAQTNSAWFTARELAENVWLIDDHNAVNIYLIEGQDASLVIDTGLGAADLFSQIRDLTTKPLIVVNTHAHPDHSGANYQFKKVYVHAADSSNARNFGMPTQQGGASMMTGGQVPEKDELFTREPIFTRLAPVAEGHIFDLGDRRIQVMETPGHTPGGICLLDIENKLLFTGDNNNILVWLFLEGCSPLHEYLETLEKQKQRFSEFDTLYPGHGIPVSKDFINDQIACVKGILDGTCESEPYESFAGTASVCTWGRASVAFDPDNL
ncbi:MAG: MBL fold metallo-hydrolase [Fidelibacterota bacterium]|nr:MAG: MBL fold metallo-hydrolase [Candidatus Neomarinimicrobiota bacterium]